MKLQENFKAYSDGELKGAERDQVTKHLESNEADRKAVYSENSGRNLIRLQGG